MALQIEKTFVIEVPRAAAWEFLTDPYRVVRCLPGAAITGKVDDQTYTGTITVKVGPVSASYKGKARFERLDAAQGSAEIVAAGQDVRGKGGADMRMKSRMKEIAQGRTEVTATSEVNVTGILAQLGRGMIQDVSDQMFQKFTEAMRAELSSKTASGAALPAPAAAAAPIEVVSFGAGVLQRAARRAVRRPAFWVVLVLLVLAIDWFWFR
ncbi:MAG: SRPBCC family protein [Thermoanaerobaculia bacterium]